jgi:dTDP-glucose 4,6-dehydratase
VKETAINLVITGAAGFVGTHLLRRLAMHPNLLATVDRIFLVDPLQYGVQNIPADILADSRYTFVHGSIYDPSVTGRVLTDGDLMIHLAAEVNTFTAPQTRAHADPVAFLDQLVEHRIGRLLVMSSADVYGVNKSADLHEDDPVRPASMYAAAKAAFEAYLLAYHAQHHLPCVIFRPVTIFGPGQYPGWLIPRAIVQALHGAPITLTGDGSVRRDFLYVDDVCALLTAAAFHDSDDIHGQIFTLGTGHERDMLTLTRQILTAVGRDESLIRFVADRPGDPPRQITTAARARATFGWSPAVSLDEGLERTVAWYQKHPAPIEEA